MAARHKGAEHHRSAAEHFERAAEHHRQASRHYVEKDFAQAAHQAVIGHGHLQYALSHIADASKYHAQHYGDEAVQYGTEHYRAVLPKKS